MHHAGAHNFNPVLVPVDGAAAGGRVAEVGNGHIHARLHEGEVVAAEAYLPVGAEDPAGEFVQRAFQVGKGDALGHGQAFNLVKVPFVGGVGGFVAVALAGDDDPHRRFLGFHHPRLHRGGVRPQQHRLLAGFVAVVNPQGVPHIPRRVSGGDVEHLEVVVVQLNFGAFHHAETHSYESGANLPHNPGGGVQAAGDYRAPGEGNIQGRLGRKSGLRQFPEAAGQGFLQGGFGAVGAGAGRAPLFRRQLRDAAEQGGKRAPAAQVGDAPLLGGIRVGGVRQL